MPTKKDYKRAYFALKAEVDRLKLDRVTDVHEIARSHGNYKTPSFHDWGAYEASMPFRTARGIRALIGRARDIDRELTDDENGVTD